MTAQPDDVTCIQCGGYPAGPWIEVVLTDNRHGGVKVWKVCSDLCAQRLRRTEVSAHQRFVRMWRWWWDLT